MNLADLLFAAEAPRDRALLHSGSDTLTRAEVEAIATDVACAAFEAGVRAGHCVAVMSARGIDVVPALFGVWRTGGVYVPVNPRLTDREIEHVIDAVDPAVIVTDGDHESRFEGRSLLVLDGGRVRHRPGSSGTRTHDADVALISFTSGTTGAPKAVKLTHSGVLELIDGVLATLTRSTGARPAREVEDDRAPMPNLVPVSLSLWAGIYNVLFAFRTGAPVVVMDRFDPIGFRDLVARFGIRSSVLPPAAMAMLTDEPRVTDLAPLRYVRSITAPLSPLQARRFRDRFDVAILNGWGQTEIGGEIVGWSAADARTHGDDKLGSVGRPHRGVLIRVLDEAGAEVADGEPGELWVRTPAMSAGYADGSDLSDRLSPDGFFRTGDVGRVDLDGFVWIDGRASSMINRGGLKVHPGEVEEVLRLSPALADVAVVGSPDQRLGEVPVAFVVTATGGRLADTELRELDELCREHLAPYKVPVRFERVDELPRNEVGKVLGRELVALLST